MTFDEYVARKRSIKDEARAKRRALDSEWINSGGDPLEDELQRRPMKENTIIGEVVEAIRKEYPGQPFDINSIITAVECAHPERAPINPTTVSGALRKLASIGYVGLARPGRGNIPAHYIKRSSAALWFLRSDGDAAEPPLPFAE